MAGFRQSADPLGGLYQPTADPLAGLVNPQAPDSLAELNPYAPPPRPRSSTAAELSASFGDNEFTKGLRRGGLGAEGTTTAFGAQVAEPFSKRKADEMFAQANAVLDFDRGLRPKIESWDQVTGPQSFMEYGLGKAGEAIPSTVASLGAAGLGGAASLGLRALTRGRVNLPLGFAAGAGSMLPMEGGEAALTMHNDPAAMANTTPWQRLGLSTAKGGINAALEFTPEALALNRAFGIARTGRGFGPALGAVGKGVAEAATGEAITEGLQEKTGQLFHGYVNPQRDTTGDTEAIREAMLGGAFGGAGLGAVSGGIHALRSNIPEMPEMPDMPKLRMPTYEQGYNLGADLGDAILKAKHNVVDYISNLSKSVNQNLKPSREMTEAEKMDLAILRNDPEIKARLEQIGASELEQNAAMQVLHSFRNVPTMADTPAGRAALKDAEIIFGKPINTLYYHIQEKGPGVEGEELEPGGVAHPSFRSPEAAMADAIFNKKKQTETERQQEEGDYNFESNLDRGQFESTAQDELVDETDYAENPDDEDVDWRKKEAPVEIEKLFGRDSLPVDQSTLEASVQDLAYFHPEVKHGETRKNEMALHLSSKTISPEDLMRLFTVKDSSKKEQARKFTDQEIKWHTRDGKAELYISPMSLANAMSTTHGDQLGNLKEGQTGRSGSRKGDIVMSSLATMMKDGVTVVDEDGNEHHVDVDISPEAKVKSTVNGKEKVNLPDELLINREKAGQEYTVGNYKKDMKDVFTPKSKEELDIERELLDKFMPMAGDYAAWDAALKAEKKGPAKYGTVRGKVLYQINKNRDDLGKVLGYHVRNTAYDTMRQVKTHVENIIDNKESYEGNPQELVEALQEYFGSDGKNASTTVKSFFKHTGLQLFNEATLKSDAMKNDKNMRPHDYLLGDLEWLHKKAKGAQVQGVLSQGEAFELLENPDATNEVAGIGNNFWDKNEKVRPVEWWQGVFSKPVLPSVKEKVIRGLESYLQRLETQGKWRIEGLKGNKFGYFHSKHEAQQFIEQIPEAGYKLLVGGKQYTLKEAAAKWPNWREEAYRKELTARDTGGMEEDREEEYRVDAAIINPETSEVLKVGTRDLRQMRIAEAVRALDKVNKAIENKSKLTVIDATPIVTTPEAMPVELAKLLQEQQNRGKIKSSTPITAEKGTKLEQLLKDKGITDVGSLRKAYEGVPRVLTPTELASYIQTVPEKRAKPVFKKDKGERVQAVEDTKAKAGVEKLGMGEEERTRTFEKGADLGVKLGTKEELDDLRETISELLQRKKLTDANVQDLNKYRAQEEELLAKLPGEAIKAITTQISNIVTSKQITEADQVRLYHLRSALAEIIKLAPRVDKKQKPGETDRQRRLKGKMTFGQWKKNWLLNQSQHGERMEAREKKLKNQDRDVRIRESKVFHEKGDIQANVAYRGGRGMPREDTFVDRDGDEWLISSAEDIARGRPALTRPNVSPAEALTTKPSTRAVTEEEEGDIADILESYTKHFDTFNAAKRVNEGVSTAAGEAAATARQAELKAAKDAKDAAEKAEYEKQQARYFTNYERAEKAAKLEMEKRKSEVAQPVSPPVKLTETKEVTGDIWTMPGMKVVSTNLGGVHGRGLAKQAKDKGLITTKNRDFDSSPLDKGVITIAVKGDAPETAKVPGQAFSESTTGKNVELLKRELRKLIRYARANPDTRINLPYVGLGFGEGNHDEIMPLLQRTAQEPNIYLVGRGKEVEQRYPESLQPGVRSDASSRTAPATPLSSIVKKGKAHPSQVPTKIKPSEAKKELDAAKAEGEAARLKFLKLIRDIGGVSVNEALEAAGEKANKLGVGTFSRKGRALDLIIPELVRQHYMTQDDVDSDVQGGYGKARELIQAALNKEVVAPVDELGEIQGRIAAAEAAWAEEGKPAAPAKKYTEEQGKALIQPMMESGNVKLDVIRDVVENTEGMDDEDRQTLIELENIVAGTYDLKGLAQQTVDSWSKKYAGGTKVQVVKLPKDSATQKMTTAGSDADGAAIQIDGKFYLAMFEGRKDRASSLSKLSHEFGHALQRIAYDKAPQSVKDKLQAQYEADRLAFLKDPVELKRFMSFARYPADTAAELEQAVKEFKETGKSELVAPMVDQVINEISKLAGTNLTKPENAAALKYITSFEEWFAEQFSKYVTSRPNTSLDPELRSFWEKIYESLKNFFNEVLKAFVPNTTFAEWVDSLAAPAAPATPAAPGGKDDIAAVAKEFDTYVKRGYYSQWYRDSVAKHGKEETDARSQMIRTYRLMNAEGFDGAGIGSDGSTVTNIPEETKAKLRAGVDGTISRVMVGNHGVYVEFTPKIRPTERGIQRRQYVEHRDAAGNKLYEQTATVNYADYKVGRWYVAAEELLKSTPPATPTVATPRSPPVIQMYYKDGTYNHTMRREFRGKSTLDLIKSGDRTASTRVAKPNYKVGDVLRALGEGNDFVDIRVTKAPYPVTDVTREEWSKLEGWSEKDYSRYANRNAWQFQYERASEPAAPVAPAPEARSLRVTEGFHWTEKYAEATLAQREARRGKDAQLVREPDNKVDPNAIKVMVDGVHHGYVPKDVAAKVAPYMDKGNEVRAHFDKNNQLYLEITPSTKQSLQKQPTPGWAPQRATRATLIHQIQQLAQVMFGKKVEVVLGPPPGGLGARGEYKSLRDQLTALKANEAELEKVRDQRRTALNLGDQQKVDELNEREARLLKQEEVLGTIYLNPKLSVREMLPTYYHESTHAAFDILLTPEERAILATAFSQGTVRKQLEKIFANDAAVLGQMKGDAEEAAAYGFQIYAAAPHLLQLGPKVETIFQKVLAWFKKMLGVLSPEQKAQVIMNDLLAGKLADKGLSPLQRQLDKDMTLKQKINKHANEAKKMVVKLWDVVASPMYNRLHKLNNPALTEFIKLGYTKTGESGDLGMIQQMQNAISSHLNWVDKFSKRYTEDQLNEAVQHRMKGTIPTDPVVQRATKDLDVFFSEFRKYAKDRGVDLGFIKNYWPMLWDAEKVMKERDAFLKMLASPKYAKEMAKLKVTPTELWENISGYVTRGDSFQNIIGPQGEPVNAYAQERSLSFITPDDRAQFMNSSPIETMVNYVTNMVRQAEYVDKYGQKGTKKKALLEEAEHKYGATAADIQLANDFLDGLLGNKEVGMSRELKDLYGAAIVYQNYRLLPFNLFTSFVDPLGIAIRSGRLTDALETFTYGIKNIFRDLKKEKEYADKDRWEQLAEDWGYIEDAGTMSNLRHMIETTELRGFSKKMNDGLFKWNLLNGWTRSTKIMAVKAAQRFMFRSAERGDAMGLRHLEELGLKPSDIFATQEGNIALRKDEFMAQGMSDTQAEQAEARMRNAMTKFVNQAILNPTAADLPNWGSNPYLAPIFHLKQFMFTFQTTILSRIWQEAKEGNMKPLWISGIYIPGMIGADAIRGFVSNMGDEPPWQKDWGPTDYVMNGVSRSGLMGAGQMFASMKDDVMHGGRGYESAVGPTVEQFMKGLSAAAKGDTTLWNFIVKSMPLAPVYDQWLLSNKTGAMGNHFGSTAASAT